MPDGSKANSSMPEKMFVQGKRLKQVAEMECYIFWTLVLKKPSEAAKNHIPTLPGGTAGMIQTLTTDPLYRKRVGALVILSPAGPGMFIQAPCSLLEESDPWVHPPGFPENAVSLLED